MSSIPNHYTLHREGTVGAKLDAREFTEELLKEASDQMWKDRAHYAEANGIVADGENTKRVRITITVQEVTS